MEAIRTLLFELARKCGLYPYGVSFDAVMEYRDQTALPIVLHRSKLCSDLNLCGGILIRPHIVTLRNCNDPTVEVIEFLPKSPEHFLGGLPHDYCISVGDPLLLQKVERWLLERRDSKC